MSSHPLWMSLYVFLGAGLGANARFWAGVWFLRKFEVAAAGTLAVNIVGSLLMGVVMALVVSQRVSAAWMPFVAAGLLGGFTTFSAYSGESMQMILNRQIEQAVLYMGASVLLSLLACYVGYYGAAAFSKVA